MEQEILRAGHRNYRGSLREFIIPGPNGNWSSLRKIKTFPAKNLASEGNSPHFVEKAGIFRGGDQQWNEAVCVDHGHANRDPL
jgi:hypothetical protein